jgi:serine O-acetyltransferase
MSRLRRLLALPALLAFLLTDRQELIAADVARWAKIEGRSSDVRRALVEIVATQAPFRNLMYHRLWRGNLAGKLLGRVCFVLLPQESTLHLDTDEIGPGLFIQHGFATVVAAKRIGARVWLNQQVTIGFVLTDEKTLGHPTIEDEATISAGAIVLGEVRVGREATVGAGAVVTKDVPDGMVAIGVPAVMRERGRNAPRAHD